MNSPFWVVFLGDLSRIFLSTVPILWMAKPSTLMEQFHKGRLPDNRVKLLRGAASVGYRLSVLLIPSSLIAGAAIFYFDNTGTYSHLIL